MDDSNIRQAILRQYRATLEMLGQAMELCPEDMWFSTTYRNRFWHIAYHALFYTHFYLQRSQDDFQPWTKHVQNSNYLGPRPWAKDEPFQIPKPYTKPVHQTRANGVFGIVPK
jgi:hypothetical protein